MDHQQRKRRILAQTEGPVHLFQRLRRKRNVGIQRRGKHIAPGAHAASGKRLLGERFLGTADRADELVHHDGLDQILPRAQLHGLLRIAEIRIGAQDDDHGLEPLRLDGLKHADAIQLRHAHVHQRRSGRSRSSSSMPSRPFSASPTTSKEGSVFVRRR